MTHTTPVTRVTVALPASPYDVTVGAGLLYRVGELVPVPPYARRAAVVASGVPCRRYAPAVVGSLARTGLQVDVVELPDGEQAKNLDTLAACYAAFARLPLGRDDLVVALGGGVVGDLAGLAAATWNRGVALVQVPTTLLAQVDAAIGGKTGVDLPEGKNLVGAFHQPIAVVADTSVLQTLPPRQWRHQTPIGLPTSSTAATLQHNVPAPHARPATTRDSDIGTVTFSEVAGG